MIHPGERASLPWRGFTSPVAALAWWMGATPTQQRRLPLMARIACREALIARCDVARGGVGQTTLATALYGWPDAQDYALVGELEDDELLAMREGWSAQLGVMEEALRWTTTTANCAASRG
jgi:hypothetical protein